MSPISEVMTHSVRTLSPEGNFVLAAQAMDELDVGSAPVRDGEQLVSIVALGDDATKGHGEEAGEARELSSQPTDPDHCEHALASSFGQCARHSPSPENPAHFSQESQ